MTLEAQKVEKTLRDVGFGSIVDKAVLFKNFCKDKEILLCLINVCFRFYKVHNVYTCPK